MAPTEIVIRGRFGSNGNRHENFVVGTLTAIGETDSRILREAEAQRMHRLPALDPKPLPI